LVYSLTVLSSPPPALPVLSAPPHPLNHNADKIQNIVRSHIRDRVTVISILFTTTVPGYELKNPGHAIVGLHVHLFIGSDGDFK
jgi:hypothetical protein